MQPTASNYVNQGCDMEANMILILSSISPNGKRRIRIYPRKTH